MAVERLELEDLPYIAQDIRNAGYREDVHYGEANAKQTSGRNEERKKITAWSLVSDLWRGRGTIVLNSTSIT
jgi:hypothetical protein